MRMQQTLFSRHFFMEILKVPGIVRMQQTPLFLPGTFLLKYQNHRLGCLSRWPSHFTKDWLNGFSANWESSICGRKLHYPGNRTQDLLQSGEVWQPFWCTFGLKKIKYQKCLVKCCDLLLLTHFAKMS